MSSRPNFLSVVLAFIHGRSPTRTDLLLVHVSGLGFATALLLAFGSRLSLLQALVLFELAWDMTGGIVANATRSTNDFYQSQPGWVRVVFVTIHFVQPLLVIWIFPQANPFSLAGLYFFMLLSALAVLYFKTPTIQKPLAMALLAAGFLLSGLLPIGEVVLAWFAPLYLTKLIYSFSVDHYKHS